MKGETGALRVRDLGEIDAPLLICGGAYGNLEALTALLDAAAKLQIPPGRIIHTGDVAAYCADPAACAELLRNAGAPAILGNVEESLMSDAEDCGCGFEKGTVCDNLSDQWYSYARERIGPELKAWMRSLPDHIGFMCAGRRVRVVHGCASSINTFLFESVETQVYEAEFQLANADIIIAGHTGLPFTRHFSGGRIWHNSGALGLPGNDGTPRVWYSVAMPDATSGLSFTHMALNYDFRTASRKVRDAHLPSAYADALETGLWPNADWLPEAEQRKTGVPIGFESHREDTGARRVTA